MERWVRVVGALLAIALCAALARAEPPINTNGGEYAIGGYDVVAYFAEGRARRGQVDHKVLWGGSAWLFSSAAHRALFEREPAKYVPAYRGYCAYGVARGTLVSVAPEAFTIYRGRLYLNYSLEIRATWLKGTDAYIARAERNWPGL